MSVLPTPLYILPLRGTLALALSLDLQNLIDPLMVTCLKEKDCRSTQAETMVLPMSPRSLMLLDEQP